MSKLSSEVLTAKARSRLMVLTGAMGFLMYGLGFSVPLLKHDLGISRAVASLHSIFFALTIMIISIILPRLINKHSPREVMMAGWIISIISLVVFSAGRSLFITIPAMAAAGVGATLFNNTNAVTVGQSSGMSIHVILRQTGIATLSGAVAPSVIGFLIRRGISWHVTLGVLAVVIGAAAIRYLPEVPDRFPLQKMKGERHWDRTLFILIGFGLAATFLEVSAGSWALDLLISREVTLKTAVVLVTVFSYGVGIGRLFFSFTNHVAARSVWMIASSISTVGFVVIIFSHSPALTVLGLSVTALGIGPIGALALAHAMSGPKGADAGIAANVIGASFSMGFGPWIMGWVSDSHGFSIAYCIPLAMVFVSLAFYLATASDKSKIT